ncbi:hypothetical protein EMIT051CA3_70006 [Pseudomonas chlororaphis]
MHPVPDQRHHPWRRAELHHGDHQPVCIDLQPVRQPVAAVRHHGPRRLIASLEIKKARFGGLFIVCDLVARPESSRVVAAHAEFIAVQERYSAMIRLPSVCC